MRTWRRFMSLYRCPADAGRLIVTGTNLRCEACGTGYPFASGFPDFRGAGPPRLAQHLWAQTQDTFEQSERTVDARMQKRNDDASAGIYARIPPLSGLVLDVGGSYGLIRRFASTDCELLVIDPWPGVLAQAARLANDPAYRRAHPFIGTPFAFVCGYAEALPLSDAEFDIVHMRSMLDHVSDPRLALTEAYRVLKPGGRVIVGLAVSGELGRLGGLRAQVRVKYHLSGLRGLAAAALRRVRSMTLLRDHHIWHATASGLRDLVTSAGFSVELEQWQAPPFDHVVYVVAGK